MEASDLPLIVPIEPTVTAMFQVSLDELTAYQRKYSDKLAAEEAKTAKPPTPPPEEQIPSKPPTGKGGKRDPKARKASKGKAVEAPPPPPPPEPEPEKPPAAEEPDVVDPYEVAAQQINSDEKAFLTELEPHQQFYGRRSEYLGSKANSAYLIEDLLGDWVTDAPENDFPGCIDVTALAQEHTQRLNEKYGYKAPRGLHEVGKVEPREEDIDGERVELGTHGAGGIGVDKEFVLTTMAPVPPTTADAEGSAVAKGSTFRSASRSGEAVEEEEDEYGEKIIDPSVMRRRSTKLKNAAGAGHSTLLKSSLRGVPSGFIEASDRQLVFDNCLPGRVYEQIITFWNRDNGLRMMRLADVEDPNLLRVDPITADYLADKPLAPGRAIQYRVRYAPVDPSPFSTVLKLGHARPSNRMDSERNQLAQWAFFEVPVQGTPLGPDLLLLPDGIPKLRETFNNSASMLGDTAAEAGEATGPVPPLKGESELPTHFEIDPTYVNAESQTTVRFMNRGSAATFVVSVEAPFGIVPSADAANSESAANAVVTQSTRLILDAGETTEVTFAFQPVSEGYEVSSAIVAKAYSANQEVEGDESTPVATFEFEVISRAVVPTVWIESAGTAALPLAEATARTDVPLDPAMVVMEDACVGYSSSKTVAVRNDGPLPVSFAWSSIKSAECGMTIYPDEGVLAPERSTVFTIELQAETTDDVEVLFLLDLFGLPLADPATFPFMSRNKRRPQLTSANINDPYRLFDEAKKVDVEVTAELPIFAGALRVVAEPTPVAASIAPTELTNAVALLVRQPNYREFTIVNSCNRDMEFWLDPPMGEDHPAAVLDEEQEKRKKKKLKTMRELYGPSYVPPTSSERPNVVLNFEPQCDVVPANSSVTVGMEFTLLETGEHEIPIECYFPMLSTSPSITLFATGRGPHVHCSHDVIDFGVIPLGEESESRVTVSNDTAIPLTFRCVDPSLPPDAQDNERRYVPLPAVGFLKPGESVEVTIYRKGLVAEDVREPFQLRVDGGQTTTIEMRAHIQKPQVYITPSVLNFGAVDRGIPVVNTVKVSNVCAIDVPYEFVVLEAPDTVQIAFDRPTGILPAGEQSLEIGIRAEFEGTLPGKALVGLHSRALDEVVAIEVCCDEINQLRVSLDVTPSANVVPERQPADFFARKLVNSMVANAVGEGEDHVELLCPAINITNAVIAEDAPYASTKAVIQIENHSGCISNYLLAASNYIPMLPPPMEATATTVVQENAAAGKSGKSSHAGTLVGTTASKKASFAKKPSMLNNSQRSKTTADKSTKDKPLALSTKNPAFTCKARDGREEKEQESNAVLKRAQNMLLDGRGCAIDMQDFVGDLPPRCTRSVTMELLSNMPGKYYDSVCVTCEGLPSVDVPVSYTVRGKPILIDPFTSGLAVDSRINMKRLALPTSVGGMSAIRRKLRITSRCPRDLEVTVSLFERGSTYLAQNPASSSAEEGNSSDKPYKAFGLVPGGNDPKATGSVSPSTFIIPALETGEFTVEYSPPAGTMGGWHATVCVTSRIAKTAFNDKFLIDEFYTYNKARFPCTRSIAAGPMIKSALDKFQMRGVDKVLVKSPLVDRPNIVQDTVIVYPSQADEQLTNESNAAEDSDDDVPPPTTDHAEFEKRARLLKERLLAEKAEREELLAYIERRREEDYTTSGSFLDTEEVMIVANNVAPALLSDPKEMLRFPMCKVGGKCDRTMRLTNQHTTPMDFRLETDMPFAVASAVLLNADGVDASQSLFGKSTIGTSGKKSIHSDPTATLFRLLPQQSVSVTVELSNFDISRKHQVEGELRVNFSNGAQQKLPLLATIHVPTVVSEPEVTWFRPPVIREDGRPQPKYSRVIALVNYSVCDAPFSVAHQPANRPLSRGSEGLNKLQRVQQTLQLSPLEQHALVIDDPARFDFSTMTGVVPAASIGGAPGRFELRITFNESSTTRFESKFAVTVEGGAGTEFTLRGDSKETEV